MCLKLKIIFKEMCSALPFIGVEYARTVASFYDSLSYFGIFQPSDDVMETPCFSLIPRKNVIDYLTILNALYKKM